MMFPQYIRWTVLLIILVLFTSACKTSTLPVTPETQELPVSKKSVEGSQPTASIERQPSKEDVPDETVQKIILYDPGADAVQERAPELHDPPVKFEGEWLGDSYVHVERNDDEEHGSRLIAYDTETQRSQVWLTGLHRNSRLFGVSRDGHDVYLLAEADQMTNTLSVHE